MKGCKRSMNVYEGEMIGGGVKEWIRRGDKSMKRAKE
jgi:hypothetical protein